MIKISEEELRAIIRESVQKILEEKIELNRGKLMANDHSYPDYCIDNAKVWTIFERYKGIQLNGDGLVIPNYINMRIESIANEINKETYGDDITIMVSSSNPLNNYFADIIGRECNNPVYFSDFLPKMTVEEVDDFIFEKDSAFRKYFGKHFLEIYQLFKSYCNQMDNDFQFDKIVSSTIKEVIEETIRLKDPYFAKYIDAINHKEIVIVDAGITSERLLEESYGIIKKCYSPLSISVVTLISPLYKYEGKNLVK